MVKIKIKIQDLFKKLNINDVTIKSEKSFKLSDNIKIKNNKNKFVNINEFVIKKIDSYYTIFNNGINLISSNEHLIKTNNGIKKIKDITKKDNVLLSNGKKIKIVSSNLHKKNDILYDFCLDYPHLYKSNDGLIHHNSLIITYVIKNLIENKKSKINNAIIIVPNKQLVEQFYGDMIDYGINENDIGRVYQKYKQWDKKITVATWQTLMNNHDKIPLYKCVIVDECHGIKAIQLKKILKKSNAEVRLGFTGTMHNSILDNLNTKSYIGPIIKEYSTNFLAKQGYISKCNINILNLKYQKQNIQGTYNEVKDVIFNNTFRMNIIKTLSKKINHNILLLVGKVEKEGEILEKILNEENTNKEVIFLSGRDDVNIREEWRKKMENSTNILMIASYGIFQQGLNIPNLKYIFLVSPFKSKIRVLQSIGRSLRKHDNKEKKGSYVFDFYDHVKYLNKHGQIRYRYYNSEKFNIKEFDFIEGIKNNNFIEIPW